MPQDENTTPPGSSDPSAGSNPSAENPPPAPENPPPAGGQPAAAASGGSDDEKTMAILAHVLGIFTSFVGPLIIWLVKKDESKFVDETSKEALNFQLTALIGYVVSAILTLACIGYLTGLAVWICAVIFGIMGAMKANEKQFYKYPMTIRFIK